MDLYSPSKKRMGRQREGDGPAYSLVNMVGRASAANILGITVRELDKLVEIYDLSVKLTNLAEPGASITWAREIKNLNRKLLTPTIQDTVIRKINENEITNSKDIRKLRVVLKDPVAKDEFIIKAGSIELKGDPQVLRKLEETERLLRDLKNALSK
jgi:ParB family transcriptional regulator, chromosome partitioning protein